MKLHHRFEYAALWAAVSTVGNLPLDVSTGLSAAVTRGVGMLAARRRGERNLMHAMPDLSPDERAVVLREMFDNFARTAVEFCHLPRLIAEKDRVEIVGRDHLETVREAGRGALLVSAHFGNWEVVRIAAAHVGWPPALIYRAFNNVLFDRFAHERMSVIDAPIFHKGRKGSLGLLRHVRDGGAALILTDQRFSGAPHLPFFGKPARTSLAAAEIAKTYDVALIPVRSERIGRESRFRVIFEAPLVTDVKSTDRIMTDVNERLEVWVRARPGQYFWLHNRWGSRAAPVQ